VSDLFEQSGGSRGIGRYRGTSGCWLIVGFGRLSRVSGVWNFLMDEMKWNYISQANHNVTPVTMANYIDPQLAWYYYENIAWRSCHN
jgi:hypothetical protein